VGSARTASHPGTSCHTGEVTGGGSLWHDSARLSKLGLATKGETRAPWWPAKALKLGNRVGREEGKVGKGGGEEDGTGGGGMWDEAGKCTL